MESRLICAGVLVVCTACGGWRMARRAALRVQSLREIQSAMERMAIRLNQGGVRLCDALEESACPIFHETGIQMHGGLRPEEAWKRACERRADALLNPEREALARFFSDLGEHGKRETAIQFTAASAELSQIERSAGERAARAEKLYPPMGMLAGLAVAVLLV